MRNQTLFSDAASTELRVEMLGGLTIRGRDGAEVSLPTAKARLLFAYLAMAPGRLQPRGRLAALLWEDRGEEQARGSLRGALSQIRAIAGDRALIGNREAVALQAGLVVTDVAALEALVAGSVATADPVALVGAFLDGIEADGALRDWIDFERARCRSLAQRLLEVAAEAAAGRGDGVAALALGTRLVALDHYREQSHRLMMRLMAQAGDNAMALAQFRACRQILKDELDVEPSEQTEALAREIAGGAGRPAPSLPAVEPEAARDFHLSIAVLPFAHAPEDEDQRFLAEGVAEDIITALTRHRDFLVIARQSSFQFGSGASADAAEGLGVRYVLSGAVRRRAGRVSISVQLIDQRSQRSVWADRYERSLEEVFEIQDDIVAQIIASVDAEVRLSERARAARTPPRNLDAWEMFHRGLWHTYNFSAEEFSRAEGFFEQATARAPDFALPHAGLAYVSLVRANWNMTDDVAATRRCGIAQAKRALAMDGTSPFAQVVLGRLLTYGGDLPRAFEHLSLARDLNPSYAHTYYALATWHLWAAEPEASLLAIERALRLSPRDPLISMFLTIRSFCLLVLGRRVEAEAFARSAMEKHPREIWARLALAAVLVEESREVEAQEVVVEARLLMPGLSAASIAPMTAEIASVVRDRIMHALGQAGLK